MTERIYYTEPACRSFDAVVTAVVEHEGAPALVLDRTAFYPTSGGQPFDIGRLGTTEVVNRLKSVKDVYSVVPFGGQKLQMQVVVDRERLAAYKMSLLDLKNMLDMQNTSRPSGTLTYRDREVLVRTDVRARTPEEVAAYPIGSMEGRTVYLRDVAHVVDGPAEERMFTRLNEVPAIGLDIRKQSTANTVETTHALVAEVRRLQADYPEIRWGTPSDFARFIEQSIHHTQREALIGAVLAVLIILLFLRNLRSTLVIALSIPISVFATFALFFSQGAGS